MASDVEYKAQPNPAEESNESKHFSDVSQAIGWVEKNGVQRGLQLWRNLKLHLPANRTLLPTPATDTNGVVGTSGDTLIVFQQTSDQNAAADDKTNTQTSAKLNPTKGQPLTHERLPKRKQNNSLNKDFIKLVDHKWTEEDEEETSADESSSPEAVASPSSVIELSSDESQDGSSSCSICSRSCHCSNSSDSSDFVLEDEFQSRVQHQSLDLNIGQPTNRRIMSPLRINSKPNQSHCNGRREQQHEPFPWFKADKRYSPGVVGLHEEIMDFYEYVRSSPQEIELRNYVIGKLEKVVQDIWPLATIGVFGSFKTGLFLPNSDLDVVIKGRWRRQPLFTLEQRLVKVGLALPDNIKVISHATVPIIKYIDAETNLRVDISFNSSGGVEAYELINAFKQQFPSLEKLLMVLKLFLSLRKMNEVFTGGLSSYCLTMLVVSFFQMHRRVEASDPNANLGVLLIEFFELYGIQFNYSMLGIRIRDNGAYLLKNVLRRQMQSASSSILCLEDPVCLTNELARGSYSVPSIQFAYESAFVVLNQECGFSMVSRLHRRSRTSLLGLVIQIPQDMVEFRQHLQRVYAQKLSRTNPPQSTTSRHRLNISNNSLKNQIDRSIKGKNNEPIFDLELFSLPSTASNASSVYSFSSDSEEDMNDNKVQLMRNTPSRRRPRQNRFGR